MRPSALFTAELPRLRDAARLGPVVDLACGRGRHALAAAAAGLPSVGIDRNPAFLRELRASAVAGDLSVATVRADLETGNGIPLKPNSCGAVLVFRFLFRPLAEAIVRVLAPGGILLYETFTEHQRELGHSPRNEAFLLRKKELLALFCGLEPIHHWEGTAEDGERPEAVARLVARKA